MRSSTDVLSRNSSFAVSTADELLGPQVVGDEPVVASERRERRAAAGRGERGEVEAGGPALRPLVQRLRLGLGHVDPRRAEERVRLGVRERELCRTELEELAVGAELGEPYLRAVRPARTICEPGGTWARSATRTSRQSSSVELVHVVEDEDDGITDGGQGRSEAGKRALPGDPGCGPERREQGRLDALAEGLRHVGEEEERIVVPVVERDPGKGATVVTPPIDRERWSSRSRAGPRR